MMRHLLFGVLLMICTGCYDSSFDEPNSPSSLPAPTTTLTELNRLVGNHSTYIDRDWVVSGLVTANDQGGNFYHSLLVEHEGAAMELSIAIEALHNDFPIGSQVVVRLEGLTVGRRFGIVQAGMAPASEGYYPTDPIRSKATLDKHLFRSDAPLTEPLPATYKIADLNASMAGRLITIEELRYLPEPTEEGTMPDPSPTWAGYHTFADETQSIVRCYVNQYADFADQPLPLEACTLTGILQYDASSDGSFILKPRNEKDCSK